MTIQSNMNKLSSDLKRLDNNGNYVVDDARLMNYLQNPGMVPSYIVLAEVERRQGEQKQREMYKAMQEGAQPSVKEQAIASLGQSAPQVPAHLMSAAQPKEMSAQERAGTPGLPTLASAGGYAPEFKEGGVVGYFDGGNVSPLLRSDPNARPYTGGRSRFRRFIDKYFPTQGMQGDKTLEQRQAELSQYSIDLDKEYGDKIVRNPFKNLSEQELIEQDALRAERDQKLRAKQIELGLAKDNIGRDEGGYDPETKDDSQKTLTLQENTPIGETNKKPTLAEQQEDDLRKSQKDKVAAEADLAKARQEVDKSYEDMMLPEDYSQQRVDALRAKMGEDTYTKLAQEEKDYLADKLAENEKYRPDLTGEGFLRAGLGMLKASGEADSQGRPKGFFASLGEGGAETAAWYEKARDKYITRKDKLEADVRAVNRDLLKSQRSEDLAIAKFGEESEQARIANNRTVGLQQKKDALTAIQLEIEGKKAEALGEYYRAGAKGLTNAQTTRGQKLLDEARKSMGNAYNTMITLEAEISKYDLSDPSKLTKAEARRYNQYLDLKDMYNRKLKEAEKLIGPALVGNNVRPAAGDSNLTFDVVSNSFLPT